MTLKKLNLAIGALSKKLNSKIHKDLEHDTVQVIKTTGLDEWKSAYTRERSIILPVNKIEAYNPESLEKLLAHEIFHILSRYNTEVRAKLYGVLGFVNRQVNESDHSVCKLRLVNPDALDSNWVFPVVLNNLEKWLMPIIFLKDGRLEFDAGDIFDRIAFELYEVDANLKNGRLIKVSDSELFNNRFGMFGFMAHHPEELLAEAFVDYIFDENKRFMNTDWYRECCEIFKEFRI